MSVEELEARFESLKTRHARGVLTWDEALKEAAELRRDLEASVPFWVRGYWRTEDWAHHTWTRCKPS